MQTGCTFSIRRSSPTGTNFSNMFENSKFNGDLSKWDVGQGKDFSEKEWITILSENPSLIQRPILINGEKAMIARPVESVKFFIGK